MQPRPLRSSTPHTQSPHTDPCNVFVKFLPSDVDDGKLHDMFSEYGHIDSSKVMIDHQTGESLGFGFVRFETPTQAQEAIRVMNGKLIGTKSLLCKLSDGPPSHLALTPGDNLYVKPLPKWVTEANLEQMFSKYGNVVQCKVMIDRDTGQSREIGFVRFETTEQATAAIRATNGTTLGPNSTPLIVKYADSEEQKAERKQKNAVKYSKPPRTPGAGSSFSPETLTNSPATPKTSKPLSVSPQLPQLPPPPLPTPMPTPVPQLSPAMSIASIVPVSSPMMGSLHSPLNATMSIPHSSVHPSLHNPPPAMGHAFGLQGLSIPPIDGNPYPYFGIAPYYPSPLPPPPPPPQMFPFAINHRSPKPQVLTYANGTQGFSTPPTPPPEGITDVVLSIRPLPESYGKENLYKIFDKFGQVKRVQIRLVDTLTSSILVGFVSFADPRHAEKAKAEWDGKKMENNVITVSIEKSTP
eukprot:TRINITY_DN4546_c0_g1_i1.p1 TRINITY_DN4546_c0_g1~~TRINITY_DN4546_c0_g1_i1.p1  ORF type:complete len:467 (+),score=84.83 TRINITY_DN4546_c0_g1_i1:116-1516(+)